MNTVEEMPEDQILTVVDYVAFRGFINLTFILQPKLFNKLTEEQEIQTQVPNIRRSRDICEMNNKICK